MALANSIRVVKEEEKWPQIGSIVLAKLPPHPHWPAIVGQCSLPEWNNLWFRLYNGRTLYWVYFYNSYQGEWVPISALVPFTETSVATLCVLKPLAMPWKGSTDGLAGAIDEVRDRIHELSSHTPDSFEDKHWTPVVGSVVLARLEIHPPWPAVVIDVSGTSGSGSDAYRCRFLPLGASNWIPRAEVSPYSYRRAMRARVRSSNIQYEEYKDALKMANKLIAEETVDDIEIHEL